MAKTKKRKLSKKKTKKAPLHTFNYEPLLASDIGKAPQ